MPADNVENLPPAIAKTGEVVNGQKNPDFAV